MRKALTLKDEPVRLVHQAVEDGVGDGWIADAPDLAVDVAAEHPEASVAKEAVMMPLTSTSGTPLTDTWGVYFNMLRPDGLSVQYTVTRGMLDELAQGKGQTTADQQVRIFNDWRTSIEDIASKKYDRQELERDVVVIRPEDLHSYP